MLQSEWAAPVTESHLLSILLDRVSRHLFFPLPALIVGVQTLGHGMELELQGAQQSRAV